MKRGGVTGSDIPPKKITSIVTAQLKEIFGLVNAHLRTIGLSRLLPAGIVIVGGGASLPDAADTARSVLKLPAQVGQIGQLTRSASVDGSWAVAYGLCRWALGDDTSVRGHSLGEILSRGWESIRHGVRNLLP
jgi:cell division ATPase FtsA